MPQIDELFEYVELPDNEKNRISELKTIGGRMTIGGETKSFRLKLDTANDLYWLLGPNDTPTWKCASISYLAGLNGKSYKRTKQEEPDTEEDEGEDENEDDEPEDDIDDENEIEDKGKHGIFRAGKKTIIILIAAAAVLFAAAIVLLLSANGGNRNAEPAVTQEIAEDSETGLISDDAQIEIIQTEQNLHKGEAVSEESVSKITVSSAEYNSMILSGLTPVKWSSVDSVEQMYANRFIPAGQYLAVNYLSTTDPTVDNPWLETAENTGIYKTITIPVSAIKDAANPYFGAKGTLTLTVSGDISPETETASPEIMDDEYMDQYGYFYDEDGILRDSEGNEVVIESEDNSVEGLSIETDDEDGQTISYVTISDAVICDIYNADGQSVYSFWSPYIDMPEVERRSEFSSWCTDETFLALMTPKSISVMIKDTQYEVISGYLDSAGVLFSPAGNAADGDVQATIVNGSQLVSDLLKEFENLPADSVAADAADETASG